MFVSRDSSPNSTCWVSQVSVPSMKPRAEPVGEGAESPSQGQVSRGQVSQGQGSQGRAELGLSAGG